MRTIRRNRAGPAHAAAALALLALAACVQAPGGAATRAGAPGAALVERDVEAPEIFQAEAGAIWDGRPSLGGIWVAATDVTDPQRVVIRNPQNGRSVIGTLYRREAGEPGPPFQLSSDAATALGIVAGRPATVAVVALRRAEVPAGEADAPAATDDAPPPLTDV